MEENFTYKNMYRFSSEYHVYTIKCETKIQDIKAPLRG